jgi:hypothetical protein
MPKSMFLVRWDRISNVCRHRLATLDRLPSARSRGRSREGNFDLPADSLFNRYRDVGTCVRSSGSCRGIGGADGNDRKRIFKTGPACWRGPGVNEDVTVLAQFVLFLSSYAPLFGVFALLESFGSGWTPACILLAIAGPILLGVVFVVVLVKVAPQALAVSTSATRDGDALAYVATYLVPFAAISVTTLREQLALGLFVILIAVLYVRAGLFYINPLLAIAGYRLFQVVTPGSATVVLIARRSYLPSGGSLQARRLSGYVYWEAHP